MGSMTSSVVLVLLALALALPVSPGARAAERSGSRSVVDQAINRVLLTDYGPCRTREEAQAAFDRAVEELTQQGGGVLVVPHGVAVDFRPVNSSQSAYEVPAVTVLDYRQGVERVYVPSVGARASLPGLGGGSRIVERTLDRNLPELGHFATQKLVSLYKGGSSSYSQRLSRSSVSGENTRFYVPTLRGLFVGQPLRVTGEPEGYGGPGDWITVKDLGLEGDRPYLVADAEHDHPEGAIIYMKHIINALTLNDISNSDNQSGSLIIDRRTYGTGDSFGIQAKLTYQGDFMSGAGDEGGVVYTAEIRHDIDGFRGEVESWDPARRELVYRAGARNPQKLGTSRPIINLNEKKWVTKGRIVVVAPGQRHLREKGHSSSLIVGSRDAGWDESLVGRFIAIDEPDEYYGPEEKHTHPARPTGNKTYRWYHVTGVERRSDGRYNLFVESQWWGAQRRGGPRLFRSENYSTSEKNTRELKYVIAPGAWASDVRFGVAGYGHGNVGTAQQDESRRLLLAPAPFFGTSYDFEPGDPVTQPPAADVWLPRGFRVRHFNGFPGMLGGASFAANNAGKVQVGSGLEIVARPGSLEEILAGQKDHKPAFESGVDIRASTTQAIRVRGPVAETALDLWSRDGNVKKLQWRLPHRKAQRRTASLYADPSNGQLVFEAAGMNLKDQATVRQTGLSATASPARNLRGIDVPVPAGASSLGVEFPRDRSEVDPRYSITVQPNWKTMDWVVRKTKEGFTVAFSEPAPRNARIDWQMIR